ncbi:calcium/proton exchanger [Anaeromyxobacter oryzae]|uniref:Ca(2+)/H(+) antiporter n=1 Tax=Anaeromyxobacter oryzae TaxID=2918170 RepID=A0ABN6MUT1_9BACT|nr:calcium/proton exchanger [Anaeromyxobacter oryzae]BDG04729.1 calcium/proton exchanger [Anaeromyxobacter oryzae]
MSERAAIAEAPPAEPPRPGARWLRPSLSWLLAFVPVALALEHGGARPPLVFFAAALAIVPIAAWIVRSTEQLAHYTGDAVGGLLNATFGNAPELIIGLVALRAGYFDMVLASLVGAILANLLLALGLAFFVGGLRHRDQTYRADATRVYVSMMLLAVTSMAVPSAFRSLSGGTVAAAQHLNLSVAVVLLALYVLYLLFMLKTHPHLFAAEGGGEGHGAGAEQWSVARAVVTLLVASALAAWMSEVLVGAAEGTGKALGMSQAFVGLVFLAIVGGAAESVSAITMGRANRMDLAVSIAIGSCIQIALFVAPVLVLLSYAFSPEPLQLVFPRVLVATIFIAVTVSAVVSGDGRSNWFKGVQLVAVYALFALLAYFVPT